MKSFNIIMFNMVPYRYWREGIVNRNYFVFKYLRQHPDVGQIFLVDFLPIKGPAPFGFRRMAKYYLQDVVKEIHPVVYRSRYSKIEHFDNVYIFSSVGLYFKKDVCFEIKRFLNNTDFYKSPVVLWSYNPLWISYYDQLKADFRVFDMVDDWNYHVSYQNYQQKLKNNYQKIDQKVDFVFTVAEELVDNYQKALAKWIPNGVDPELFKTKEVKNLNFKKPIIGYVGTIQDRVDIDLIKYLAENNSDKSFVLAGPIWKDKIGEVRTKLKNLENLFLLGRVKYNQVPALINSFDLTFIPHKVDKFIKTTNPMKMYEYLACGKQIVTTSGAGVNSFEDIIYIKDKYDDFNRAINQALTKDKSTPTERKLAVAKHSYKKRVDLMVGVIKQQINY